MLSRFTFSEYARLLDSLVGQGLDSLTVRDYIRRRPESGFVILRHDVEWGTAHALEMAKLEQERGLRSTFYYHGPHRKKVFVPDEMKKVEDLGHEVGYHYETLDLTEGDFEAAEALFAEQLARYREAGLTIDTVCMHGNPRKKKVGYKRNGDLFMGRVEYMCEQYGLIGEAYESIPAKEMSYVSDVGIRFAKWGTSCPAYRAIVDAGKHRDYYILTHPDYWSWSTFRAAGLSLAGQAIRGSRVNWMVKELKARLRGSASKPPASESG